MVSVRGTDSKGEPGATGASTLRSNCHRLRLIGVTIGGISTLGLAVPFASNCAGLRNTTLHWLRVCVSIYR